jgi:alpha-beta hydrolase superfamily lysophospholipase
MMREAFMFRRHFLAAPILVTGLAQAQTAEAVTLKAADGVAVYGQRLRAGSPRRGTILLFHMAGSNFGEYAPIAPQLVAHGFDTLAIDQRSGGRLWGRDNATVAGLGRSTDFAAALADLRAALAFAQGGGKIVVLGSSYSAALVFLLAAGAPDIAALASFSPGEFIAGASIRAAAARLRCPCLVTSASDVGEIAEARRFASAVPGGLVQHYVPRQGVHGASSLRADANPTGAAANMAVLLAFLEKVVT